MKNSSMVLSAILGGFPCWRGEAALPPIQSFSALYAFGDSLDATSGGPYWQGSWSNGPVWPEVLSTNLGFSFQPANSRAAGGAMTGPPAVEASFVGGTGRFEHAFGFFAGPMQYQSPSLPSVTSYTTTATGKIRY